MLYFALFFLNIVCMYVFNWMIIFSLKNEYKDIYESIGSPSMFSQYPTYVFELIKKDKFSRLGHDCKIYVYLMLIFMFLWPATLVLMVRNFT